MREFAFYEGFAPDRDAWWMRLKCLDCTLEINQLLMLTTPKPNEKVRRLVEDDMRDVLKKEHDRRGCAFPYSLDKDLTVDVPSGTERK